MWINICSVILVLSYARGGFGASKAAEQGANSVFIRYNDVTVERWDSDPEDTGTANTASVKETISSLANTRCGDDPEDCSLANIDTMFQARDVVIADGSPEVFNGDLKLTFSVSIDGKNVDNAKETKYFIPKATLTEICTEGAEALSNATNGKFQLDFVNDERVSPALDTTVDSIMIPLSIAFLLIMIIIVLVLHFYHKKKDEKDHLPTGAQGGDVVMTEVKTGDGGQGAAQKASPSKGRFPLSAVSPLKTKRKSSVSNTNKVTPNSSAQQSLDDGYSKSSDSETPMVKKRSRKKHRRSEEDVETGARREEDESGDSKRKHKKKKKHKHKRRHRERSEEDDETLVTPRYHGLPPLAEYRVRSDIPQDVIYTA